MLVSEMSTWETNFRNFFKPGTYQTIIPRFPCTALYPTIFVSFQQKKLTNNTQQDDVQSKIVELQINRGQGHAQAHYREQYEDGHAGVKHGGPEICTIFTF